MQPSAAVAHRSTGMSRMLSRLVGVVALTLALGGCAQTLQRNVEHEPILDKETNTLWIVEKVVQSQADDKILITICHRDGSPACLRMSPTDARDAGDYSRWIESVRAELKRTPAPAQVIREQ